MATNEHDVGGGMAPGSRLRLRSCWWFVCFLFLCIGRIITCCISQLLIVCVLERHGRKGGGIGDDGPTGRDETRTRVEIR